MAELQVLEVLAQFTQAGFLLPQRGVELFFLLLDVGLVGVLAFPQQLDFTLDDLDFAPAQFRGVFSGCKSPVKPSSCSLERLIVGAQLVESLLNLQLPDLALQPP